MVRERTVVMRAVELTKTYAAVSDGAGSGGGGRVALELFRGLDLKVHAGEMVAIVGESGAGKSSLLHLLAALDTPTAGEVWCGETRLVRFHRSRRRTFAIAMWGMCGSFITCCRSFRRWRMSLCRCWLGGWGGRRRWRGARFWLGEVGLGGAGGASVGRVERRGAAEGEPGAGAGDGAEDSAGG